MYRYLIGIGRLCNCHIGIGIGIGRYENQIYRWLSVSADMKKCLSVAHYLRPILYSFFVYEMFFAIIHRALVGIQAGVQAIAEPGASSQIFQSKST